MKDERFSGVRLLVAAVAVGVALLGGYLLLGGATYKPLPVNDPCSPRLEPEASQEQLLQRIVLSALDGAACELRVPREDLALALASEDGRAAFAERYGISDEETEAAVKAGLARAIDDAKDRDEISSFEAGLLSTATSRLPVGTVIDVLQSSAGKSVLDVAKSLLGL
ncbi:hypothetical protein BH10ACT11_BH10ACT11_11390 [soil metagenome]